jgi:predicted enzyme related to lactoylglutathione lyase
MKFKMSPNIAIRTDKYREALEFYSRVFGFQDRSVDPELGDFDASPLNMFVIEDQELNGVVMELFVEDLEKAREELVINGCEVIRWRGARHKDFPLFVLHPARPIWLILQMKWWSRF